MKETSDPKRLLSDAARGSVLERGLTMARGRGPTDGELSALRASLFGGAAAGGAIVAGAARAGAKPGPTVGATGWRALGLTKAATALVIASAVAAGTAVGWRRVHPSRSEHRAPAGAVVERKEVPHLVPHAPTAIRAPLANERRRSSTVAVATRPRALRPTAPVEQIVPVEPIVPIVPPASEADEELALLGKAQRALPKDPELALSFVRDHERRYPDGLLGQEREAVAVSALWQVGRRDEARQRAERFAEEHPRSTYISRMRRILAQPSDEKATDKEDDISPSTVGGRK